jgi:hypothetical protein
MERRARDTRESLPWLKAIDGVVAADQRCRALDRGSPAATQEPQVIDVADRAGDTFEFLDHEDVLGRQYVLRSQHNRSIRLARAGTAKATVLHDYLRSLPARGERRRISLSERDKRPARKAEKNSSR